MAKFNRLFKKKSKTPSPPEPLDGVLRLKDHYYFLSTQRNTNGFIDINAVENYMRHFDIGNCKMFIEIIYTVDKQFRKERNYG